MCQEVLKGKRIEPTSLQSRVHFRLHKIRKGDTFCTYIYNRMRWPKREEPSERFGYWKTDWEWREHRLCFRLRAVGNMHWTASSPRSLRTSKLSFSLRIINLWSSTCRKHALRTTICHANQRIYQTDLQISQLFHVDLFPMSPTGSRHLALDERRAQRPDQWQMSTLAVTWQRPLLRWQVPARNLMLSWVILKLRGNDLLSFLQREKVVVALWKWSGSFLISGNGSGIIYDT